ncbi:MAG: histidine phosphatase family protein [Chloroflexota bacterium]|nr:histidine phosphatase family protein [Chloroflexota bacterium]
MRLLVARHGATAHNENGRITGQTDAPLSALGQRQAEALGERLAGARFDAIVSSDLARAMETAEAVARRMGLPVMIDPDLREIAMGAWEGRVFAELLRDEPEMVRRVELDPLGAWGAPEGETWARFSGRVHGALARWRDHVPAGKVLWVTHGGVVSVLLLRALGLTFDRRRQFRRDNTSLFEFDYTPTAPIRVLRVNDTGHLERFASDAEGERAQAL